MRKLLKIGTFHFFGDYKHERFENKRRTILLKIARPLKSNGSNEIRIRTYGIQIADVGGRLKVGFLKRLQIVERNTKF